MEITSNRGITFLTGTRCNDNLYYLDSHHIENAIAFVNRSLSYPYSEPESKSETSVTMSEDADESHQSEESEDAQLEPWYRENGMFDNMGDMEEAFNEHLQDIQNPNNPLNLNLNPNNLMLLARQMCACPRSRR